MVDGDHVLFESPVICVYICEFDASLTFIPPLGHPNRPTFFQWLAYLNNTLQAEFMLWRYAQNYATAADSIEDIKAALCLVCHALCLYWVKSTGIKGFYLVKTSVAPIISSS